MNLLLIIILLAIASSVSYFFHINDTLIILVSFILGYSFSIGKRKKKRDQELEELARYAQHLEIEIENLKNEKNIIN